MGSLFMMVMGNPSIILGLENPIGKFESKNFVVTNMSTVLQNSYSGDKFLILGILTNIGNKTFNEVSLLSNLYDKGGNLIDVIETTPFHSVGFPNSSSPYKFEVYVNASQFDHYLIQVAGRENSIGTNIFESDNTNQSILTGGNNTNALENANPKTFNDCYKNIASTLMLMLVFTPETVDLTSPEIKTYLTNACNFYHEKTGIWISTHNELSTYGDKYGQEFRQKYPAPASIEKLLSAVDSE